MTRAPSRGGDFSDDDVAAWIASLPPVPAAKEGAIDRLIDGAMAAAANRQRAELAAAAISAREQRAPPPSMAPGVGSRSGSGSAWTQPAGTWSQPPPAAAPENPANRSPWPTAPRLPVRRLLSRAASALSAAGVLTVIVVAGVLFGLGLGLGGPIVGYFAAPPPSAQSCLTDLEAASWQAYIDDAGAADPRITQIPVPGTDADAQALRFDLAGGAVHFYTKLTDVPAETERIRLRLTWRFEAPPDAEGRATHGPGSAQFGASKWAADGRRSEAAVQVGPLFASSEGPSWRIWNGEAWLPGRAFGFGETVAQPLTAETWRAFELDFTVSPEGIRYTRVANDGVARSTFGANFAAVPSDTRVSEWTVSAQLNTDTDPVSGEINGAGDRRYALMVRDVSLCFEAAAPN